MIINNFYAVFFFGNEIQILPLPRYHSSRGDDTLGQSIYDISANFKILYFIW